MPNYAVTLDRRKDGSFIATFPDFPEAVAFGQNAEETLEEASHSLAAAIRRRMRAGEEVPGPEASGPLRIHQEVLAAVLS